MNLRFNVRVYGICMQDGKVLVNNELIRGKNIIKFPGGGLEYGEGTIECLIREFKEELGLDIEVVSHYYTTDFFMASAYDQSQVISIYYLVKANVPDPIQNLLPDEVTYWQPLHLITDTTFSLAIDRKVGMMIRDEFGG